MGLIKADSAKAVAATQFSMRDVEQAARAMLSRARQQADQLLAEAQRQAEQLKQQAHAQGLAEGRSAGQQQGIEQGRQLGQKQALEEHRKKLVEAVQAFAAAAAAVEGHRQQLVAEAQADVIRLALAIASRITRWHGTHDPAVLQAICSDAIRLAVGKTDVRVAVHPSQRQTLEAIVPQLKLQFPTMQHVQILDDPSLVPGGCRVGTAAGDIDADLQTQIDRIAAALLPTPPDAN
jgi:flagellar assembly protein FliH